MVVRRRADFIAIHGDQATNHVAAALACVPPPWVDRALCAETDPAIFFPEPGGSVKAAKKVCAQCPVTQRCLEYALEWEVAWGTVGSPSGIFGGATPRARQAMLRARKQAAS